MAHPPAVLEPMPSCSVSEAASALGVSRVSIWRWIRDGQLPATRVGQRGTRILRQDLEDVLLRLGRSGAAGAEREHFVQFYEWDETLVSAVADYSAAALRAGDAAVLIATEKHQQAIDERLLAERLDLAGAHAAGRYVTLGAAATLARFMAGGMPDAARFRRVVGAVLADASAGGRRVRAFGEMVALLALDGNHQAAIRLEGLWNQLQRTRDFSLFCAYSLTSLAGDTPDVLMDHVCGEHSRVVPAESWTSLPSHDQRLRAVAALQHKVLSLEGEVARLREVSG